MPAKVARTQIDRAQDEIGRPAGKLMFLHKFAFFKSNTQQNYLCFFYFCDENCIFELFFE